jgi:hypothetical protein
VIVVKEAGFGVRPARSTPHLDRAQLGNLAGLQQHAQGPHNLFEVLAGWTSALSSGIIVHDEPVPLVLIFSRPAR